MTSQPSWEMNPESLLCCFSRSSSIFSSPSMFVNAGEGKRSSPPIASPAYTSDILYYHKYSHKVISVCSHLEISNSALLLVDLFQGHDHYLAPSSRCTIHNTSSDCLHQTNAPVGTKWTLVDEQIRYYDIIWLWIMNKWSPKYAQHEYSIICQNMKCKFMYVPKRHTLEGMKESPPKKYPKVPSLLGLTERCKHFCSIIQTFDLQGSPQFGGSRCLIWAFHLYYIQ